MSDDDEPKEGDPFEQLAEDVEDREGDPFDQLTDQPPADAGDDEPGTQPDSDESASTGGQSGSSESADRQAGDQPEGVRQGPQRDEQRDQTTQDPIADSMGPSTSPDRELGAGESTSEMSEAGPQKDPTDSSQMAFGVGRDKTTGTEDDPFVDTAHREGDPFEGMDDAFDEMEAGGVDPDEVWQDLASAESRGSVGDATERTYADVSKHSYCEQCPHFSGPPEIRCTHEGTEIVEFLDMDSVRVVDCPIVAERKEIREGNAGPE